MSKENIMIIKTCKRRDNVETLQKVLTQYGCIIKMRLGIHEAGNVCSDEGLIILQLAEDPNEVEKLVKGLDEIDGITYKLVQI
jgi:hypothetical protein